MTDDPNYNMTCRAFVLQFALMLEFLTGSFLRQLLGIDADKSTLSFSEKSTSLSFNQKIILLIDLEVMAPTVEGKFKAFMQIRNKFMHVLQCSTYEICLKMSKTNSFLSKQYPQAHELSEEAKAEKMVSALCEDVLSLTLGVIDKIRHKNRAKENALQTLERTGALVQAVKTVPNIIDTLIKEDFHKTLGISEDQLGALGDRMHIDIYNAWSNILKSKESE